MVKVYLTLILPLTSQIFEDIACFVQALYKFLALTSLNIFSEIHVCWTLLLFFSTCGLSVLSPPCSLVHPLHLPPLYIHHHRQFRNLLPNHPRVSPLVLHQVNLIQYLQIPRFIYHHHILSLLSQNHYHRYPLEKSLHFLQVELALA